MKNNVWSIIMIAAILLICVVGGFFIHNAIETKKQVELAQEVAMKQQEAEQNIEDFLSMLPADFLVCDEQDGGYVSNLFVRISQSETGSGKLDIEMKPVGSNYSKDITYYGGGTAELFLEGMNATCIWNPSFCVMEGDREVITEEGKRYNKVTIYLDEVDLNSQEVKINNTYNHYVLRKQNA